MEHTNYASVSANATVKMIYNSHLILAENLPTFQWKYLPRLELSVFNINFQCLKKKKYKYETVAVLEEWFLKNVDKPYASNKTKEMLSKKANLSGTQVSKWLIKRRNKPKKEPQNSKERLSGLIYYVTN